MFRADVGAGECLRKVAEISFAIYSSSLATSRLVVFGRFLIADSKINKIPIRAAM